jgi:hypothetical protein
MAVGRKTGGRKKGTPNKVTGDLRSMVLGALEDAGGQKYLAKQAEENPNAFLSLLGRCLPKDITNSDGTLAGLANALYGVSAELESELRDDVSTH